jgi:hypothetical protein
MSVPSKGGRPPKRKINDEEKPNMLGEIIVRSQAGGTEQNIADELGITRSQVRSLKSTPEYLELVKKQKEEAEKRIVSHVVGELESMVPLFVEGFKKNLQEGKPESQRLFVEMVGLKAKDGTGEAQLGGITVIMPGAKTETIIDVSKGSSDGDQV